jgi:hypothetical protein
MATLPSVSGERAVRIFQKAGWIKDRQRGSQDVGVGDIFFSEIAQESSFPIFGFSRWGGIGAWPSQNMAFR